MSLATFVFLSLLGQTLAAPQTLVTQWPPRPPVMSTPVTSTIPTGAAATTTCPQGFTEDANRYCRKTSTTVASSATPFSCPSGFTPDYRGMSYCRPTMRATSTWNNTTSKPTGYCPLGAYTDYRGICRSSATIRTVTTPLIDCSPGSYADYRGICRSSTSVRTIYTTIIDCSPGSYADYRGICRHGSSPVSAGPQMTPTTLVEKRTITTVVDEELKCDTIRNAKCPDDLRCKEIRECPPFIAFCPGTCVKGWPWPKETKVPE